MKNTMRVIQKFVFVFLLCVAPALKAGGEAGAESFLQNLGDRVLNIINAGNSGALSDDQVHDQVRAILEGNFALNAMGKFALGKYWRRANKVEKAEFQDLFRLTVVHNYTNRFETYTDERFEVTGSRREKDGSIIVTSEIVRPSGPPLRLDWRLYKRGGHYKVYDVLVDGISMSITLRSEYASVIQREGGHIAGLNRALRSKWSARAN